MKIRCFFTLYVISLMLFNIPLVAQENVDLLKDQDNLFYTSQASQDEFVCTLLYGILQKKDKGYYLDLGAFDPIEFSNTFILEKRYGWTGISIDIDAKFYNPWIQKRSNPILISDALKVDYKKLLENFPEEIDYLSLDIDGSYDEALYRVLKSGHTFKVITIEHDSYRYGDKYKQLEQKLLLNHGYYLLFEDITFCGIIFEDWWIHPKSFPEQLLVALEQIKKKSIDHREAVNEIKKLLNYAMYEFS